MTPTERNLLAVALAILTPSCVGTTGGDLFEFQAAASGPSDVTAGSSLSFTSDLGWHVVLDKAVLHVGAVYLNESVPVSGAQNTACVLPGTYVAEVTSGRDVDLLSPAPQVFPEFGTGTTLPARVGQVWLTGGDINRVDDRTAILVIAGTADKDGIVRKFDGTLTIGSNRQTSDPNGGGANPICKQRIVTPIPTFIQLASGGSLRLTIDPRALFVNVDFGQLPQVPDGYAFADDSSDQASRNLYQALHAAGSLYAFEWVKSP